MFGKKSPFRIRIEKVNKYLLVGSYVDEDGRYHEAIADGIYAVWPSFEEFKKARAH